MIVSITKWFNKNNLYHDIIECLTSALEAKDNYTSGHSTRVADMAYELAKKIGVKGKELQRIHMAAHLHDIGKIGIPDRILHKKGRLLPHEFALIQQHPIIGYNTLKKSKKLSQISRIVLHHHERWDGEGYPTGIAGKKIPLGSRIIAICDTIDAMTTKRSYREAFTWEYCIQEIKANQGLQFDPELVDAAQSLFNGWERRYNLDNKRKVL